MDNNLKNKYFVRRSTTSAWEDVTTMFDGIKVLSISGFNEKGDAQNVYTAQWVNSQTEDYMLTGGSVVRANVDLTMTFVAGTRYSVNKNVNTQAVYDDFVNYICNNGDFYIRSAYTGKQAHVVCMKGVKPTDEKLHRGMSSYILATATLHLLGAPSSV